MGLHMSLVGAWEMHGPAYEPGGCMGGAWAYI